MKFEKGSIHLIVLLVLIVGIITGLALINRPQIFKSQAEEMSEVPFYVIGHEVHQSNESIEETKHKVESLRPDMVNSTLHIGDATSSSSPAAHETVVCNPFHFDPHSWTIVDDVCRDTYSPNERRAVYECQNERKVIETPNDPKCLAQLHHDGANNEHTEHHNTASANNSQENNHQVADEHNALVDFAHKSGKTLADAKSFIQREFFGNIAKAFHWLLGRN